jgi:hypothetical protein
MRKFIGAVLILGTSVLVCGDIAYAQYRSSSSTRERLPREGYSPQICEYAQKFVNGVANICNTYDGYERSTRANRLHKTFNNMINEYGKSTRGKEHEFVFEIQNLMMDWTASIIRISDLKRDNIADKRMRTVRKVEATFWQILHTRCGNLKKPDIKMLEE